VTTTLHTLTYKEEEALIDEVASTFPREFGLKNFPGDTFRVSRAHSYYSRGYDNEWGKSPPQVMLYTDIVGPSGDWEAFAKGTIQELRQQIVIVDPAT